MSRQSRRNRKLPAKSERFLIEDVFIIFVASNPISHLGSHFWSLYLIGNWASSRPTFDCSMYSALISTKLADISPSGSVNFSNRFSSDMSIWLERKTKTPSTAINNPPTGTTFNLRRGNYLVVPSDSLHFHWTRVLLLGIAFLPHLPKIASSHQINDLCRKQEKTWFSLIDFKAQLCCRLIAAAFRLLRINNKLFEIGEMMMHNESLE